MLHFAGESKIDIVRMGVVDWSLPLMMYGDASRVHRRLFHQSLNTNQAKKLESLQHLVTYEFLYRLVENPRGFFEHVTLWVMLRLARDRRFNAHRKFSLTWSLMLMITYGIRSKSEQDPHFVVARRAAAAICRAMTPGAFLVNTFPICKRIWSCLQVTRVKFPRSEAHSRVVPRRWLSHSCEGR